MKTKNKIKNLFFALLVVVLIYGTVSYYNQKWMLNKVIERLSADSRAAEALVTSVSYEPQSGKYLTTIKFLEYNSKGEPMEAKYFTFSENIIQFQAMVIRFDDFYVRGGHPLKGKSAYIFTKAFTIKDKAAEVFEINKLYEIPSGYEVKGVRDTFEKRLWQEFWNYALRAEKVKAYGVKNAQIEAPGTKFLPGMLYTLKIEHDGGLRIDTARLPQILNKEKIDF